MDKDDRKGIIGAIDTKTKVLALIALVAEGLALGSLTFLREEQRLYAVVAAAVILVIATIGIVTIEVMEVRVRKSPLPLPGDMQISCELLPSRLALYQKAREIVLEASHVLDTTWGGDPTPLSPTERAAADAYMEARRQIVQNGKEYRELFTVTKRREERLHKSADDSRGHPNYQVRVLRGLGAATPMIDFLVVDSSGVLLSFIQAEGVRCKHQYLFVRCPAVGAHFTEYFEECWRVARPLSDFPQPPTNVGNKHDKGTSQAA